MKLTKEQAAAALETFAAYFVQNYPGPHTIISDPNWHAPKIFRAALYAIESESPIDARREAFTVLASAMQKFAPDLVKTLVERWEAATTESEIALAAFLQFLRSQASAPREDSRQ